MDLVRDATSADVHKRWPDVPAKLFRLIKKQLDEENKMKWEFDQAFYKKTEEDNKKT